MEGLRKTVKNLGHNSQCPGRVLNQRPAIYSAHRFLLLFEDEERCSGKPTTSGTIDWFVSNEFGGRGHNVTRYSIVAFVSKASRRNMHFTHPVFSPGIGPRTCLLWNRSATQTTAMLGNFMSLKSIKHVDHELQCHRPSSCLLSKTQLHRFVRIPKETH
jgi:hypothetical protein